MPDQTARPAGSGRPKSPAIFASRNPDATMHLSSLEWRTLPDGTLLLECTAGSPTATNLDRDPFSWVVLHDNEAAHITGKAFLEPTDPEHDGRVAIRFLPDVDPRVL